MTNPSRLYRSNTDKVIGGVAGGLGDYLNVDPVVVRVLFVLLAIFGGSGVLVYIILWIAIPAEIVTFQKFTGDNPEANPEDENIEQEHSRRKNTSLIVGVIMIVLGLIFLIDRLVPFYNLASLWPLLIILAGVLLISPEIFKTSKNIKS